MRNGSLTLGGVPQLSAKVTGRGEPVVDVLPTPLTRLSSEKAALVRHFRCTEFELRACVAIALNKLDASSMETTRIRVPWGPLVASSLRSNADSPGPLRLSNARSFLDSASNRMRLPTSIIILYDTPPPHHNNCR